MNNKGFTLIELVVAIAIMGVIMVISIPTVKYFQNNHKDTKYVVYEKAIGNAAKLYVDSYDNDLFGITNNGCALITYEDLKNKNLIEDIQLKNTDCSNKNAPLNKYYSYVFVRKAKNGNYNYDTHVACKENDDLVYGQEAKEITKDTCALEDGTPPTLDIIVTPDKKTYHRGDEPTVTLKISDKGVGLKENQKLNYRWYRSDLDNPMDSEKILDFENNNYDSEAKKEIVVPSLSNINESINYLLKVTGQIQDIDNNTRDISEIKKLEYFVGMVIIKMNANGASLVTPYNSMYKLASDGSIIKNNDDVITKIKYNDTLGTSGLLDYNSSDELNIIRSGYHIDSGKEWVDSVSGKEFDQDKVYGINDFVEDEEELKEKNVTVNLKANWKRNMVKMTYDNNGGDGCSSQTVVENASWGTLCVPTRKYYRFAGWFNSGIQVTPDTVANSDITVTAKWIYLQCQSGHIKINQAVPTDNWLDKNPDAPNLFVKTFHWEYSSSSCSGTNPTRSYKFKHVFCQCNIDMENNKFCSVGKVKDITNWTHKKTNYKSIIHYQNNANGRAACSKDYPVNSYVNKVCTTGTFNVGQTALTFHGYVFYKGLAQAPYNKFSPSSYWTHTGGDYGSYNDRVPSSASSSEACSLACRIKYGT